MPGQIAVAFIVFLHGRYAPSERCRREIVISIMRRGLTGKGLVSQLVGWLPLLPAPVSVHASDRAEALPVSFGLKFLAALHVIAMDWDKPVFPS